jgi:predicted acylesterase/phospholipase RssA
MEVSDDFANVLAQEEGRIRERRKQAYPDDPARQQSTGDMVGFALSGGGVRSATFNMGVLQAFQRFSLLRHVDYLSTVSGGGYIGSSLTWLLSALKERNLPFPFGIHRKDHDKAGGVLHWLRDHGCYLIPGGGLTFWSLIAASLAGIFVNLLVLAPVFLLAIYAFARPATLHIGVLFWSPFLRPQHIQQ